MNMKEHINFVSKIFRSKNTTEKKPKRKTRHNTPLLKTDIGNIGKVGMRHKMISKQKYMVFKPK